MRLAAYLGGLSVLGGCLPSIDLALPEPVAGGAVLLVAPGRPVHVVDPNTPLRFAVDGLPLVAVTLGHTITQLQIPIDLDGEHPRELVTKTATVWEGTLEDERYRWQRSSSRISVGAPAFDVSRCLLGPTSCVRVDDDGSRWCNGACSVPTVEAPQTPSLPQIDVEPLVDLDCADDELQLDARCEPVAVCPTNGVPADLPNGARYDVALGEDLEAAIVRETTRTVFLLPIDYVGQDVVADRRVDVWGPCPSRTDVKSITLRDGGSVGRLRVQHVDVTATATITQSIIDTGAVANADLVLERVRIDGQFDIASSTTAGTGVALARVGTLALEAGQTELRDVVGVDRSRIVATRNDLALTNARFSRDVKEDIVLRIIDGRATIERLFVVRSAQAVRIEGSEVGIVNVMLRQVNIGMALVGATVRATDISVESASTYGIVLDLPESAASSLDLHRYATRNVLNAIGTHTAPLEGAIIDASDLSINGGGVGIEANPGSTVTVRRADFETLRQGFVIDNRARVTAEDLVFANALEAFSISADAEVTLTRIQIANSEQIMTVFPPPPTIAPRYIVVEQLQAFGSGGLSISSPSRVELRDFRMEAGNSAGFDLVAPADFTAERGTVAGYAIGYTIDTMGGRYDDGTVVLNGVRFDVEEVVVRQ